MKEALKLALEALYFLPALSPGQDELQDAAIEAIKEALAQPEQERCVGCEACIDTACGRDECPKGWPKAAQPEQEPEFIKHEVENAEDWSEWVCPNPHKYLMKCCDCGLVHEAQFGVVRYKSEEEREACDFVDDPNMQAVFRMRRSEQWSPEDTAHRAGGLPMEQPEQEPVACPECKRLEDELEHANIKATVWKSAYDVEVGHNEQDTTPPQRKPLTDEEIGAILEGVNAYGTRLYTFARAIEAAHGIKGDA